jgi:hypothetical protein
MINVEKRPLERCEAIAEHYPVLGISAAVPQAGEEART